MPGYFLIKKICIEFFNEVHYSRFKTLTAKGLKKLAAGRGAETCDETGLLRLEAALSGKI